ncbi:putative zinc finger protein [Apostichopus japonicus]|uniref:Putative zinc finger protein n=1 Tax=Stichopus japonicus TaxID=307972 RepID=A0A2G8LCT2_STIJA|nr:putative zinc finger protein [Apostichopus japonicus]
MFGSGGIPEVIMADATETVEPSKVSIPGLQSSFVPQGEATLIHQNEKGELVGPEGSAKSVDEYLYCRLCQAKFEVVKDAMVHYNGEDHKEISDSARKRKVSYLKLVSGGSHCEILLSLSATMDNESFDFLGFFSFFSFSRFDNCQQTNQERRQKKRWVGEWYILDDKGCLWGAEKNALTLGEFKRCMLCSVTASSFKTAKEHYNGNKHIKRLKRRAEIEGLEFKSLGKKLYMAVAQGQIERDDDPMGLSEDMRTKVHKDAAAERGKARALATKRGGFERALASSYRKRWVRERSSRKREVRGGGAGGEQEEEGEGVKLEEDMEKASEKPAPVPDPPVTPIPAETQTPSVPTKPNTNQYCSTCQLELSSKRTAELHYEGRKHAKMLALKKYGPDLTKNGKPVLDLAGAGVLYCSSCEVMCITREQLDEHNAGQKHLSVVEGEKQRQKEAQEATTGDLGYGCRICDVKLNSKQNYIEHKQSRKHLKKWRAKEEKKMEGKMPYGGFRPEQYPPFPPMPGPHHPPPGGRGRGFDVMEHGGWESERPPFERAGPGDGKAEVEVEGDHGTHQDFSGEGHRHRSDSETGGSSQGFDFSKAVSSEGGLSEVILKYLPKEALVQLAMEALTSKSKELMGMLLRAQEVSVGKGTKRGKVGIKMRTIERTTQSGVSGTRVMEGKEGSQTGVWEEGLTVVGVEDLMVVGVEGLIVVKVEDLMVAGVEDLIVVEVEGTMTVGRKVDGVVVVGRKTVVGLEARRGVGGLEEDGVVEGVVALEEDIDILKESISPSMQALHSPCV